MAGDGTHDVLAAYLAAHTATTDVERADLDRLRTLAASGNPWDRATPVHVTASALVLHPPSQRVLMRWHARQRAWLHVGGHADPGEVDPLTVATREGTEETGLEDLRPWPAAVLQHVALVAVPANAVEPAHVHADVRFFLATDDPDAARPEKPDAPVRWVSIADALALTTQDNVRETIRRAARAMDASAG
jgi:8-oxo-dGTP pyrophosphatase MutT (NUDIX family)